MTTLFISDLHLDPARPGITRQFLGFLETEARRASALYILGDLFEAWVGDDAPLPEDRDVIRGLRAVTDAGVPVYFMRGNRDFLIGRRFARDTGVTILTDPTVVDLYGEPAALLHGDTLCTDDVDYQRFRARVRRPWVKWLLLSLPRRTRRRIAERLRETSQQAMAGKETTIMDVNPGAVAETFRRLGVRTMIHGHTHRPAVHEHDVDHRACRRIVLGDWYEQGSVLRCDESGCRLEGL